ncbi:hypothetical protein ACSFA2_00485 [Variovorax sp. LT2P21]|uniref:hypothetical protein n=1 Tax=Variovorax sp. LT2P21 TaxID=3443731 RepID=UPI003F4491C1
MRRTRHQRIAIVCMALCTWIGTVQAQEASGAWRCGNTYTDQPCKGGKAVALDEAPSADQAREAERATRRTQAAADRMERDRLRQEKAAPSPLIHLPKPTQAVSPAEPAHPTAKKKKGRKEPDFFTAAGPGTSKKKKAEKTEAGS